MSTYNQDELNFVHHIMTRAKANIQRTGQYMFNNLPDVIANKVAGTSFDPFHKELSAQELYDWIDGHLVFDGNEIVGLFHENRILWETPSLTTVN